MPRTYPACELLSVVLTRTEESNAATRTTQFRQQHNFPFWADFAAVFAFVPVILVVSGVVAAVALTITIRRCLQHRKTKREAIDSKRSLVQKEIESLWCMHEGQKRDALLLWEAENKQEAKCTNCTNLGRGMVSCISKPTGRQPLFYFQLIPPETVEQIASFVEGHSQHIPQHFIELNPHYASAWV